MILSVLVGVRREGIARRLPGAAAIVRALRTTPVAIGGGVVLLDEDPAAPPRHRVRRRR